MLKLLLILSFILSVLSAELPSSFKKCNKNDRNNFNQCLCEAMEDAVHKLTVKPYPEIGLTSFNPLVVPSLFIGVGNGPIQFNQTYNNLEVTGFEQTKCDRAIFNFDTYVLKVNFTIPKLVFECDLDLSGKLLAIPVKGKGPAILTSYNSTLIFDFKLSETEKRGTKFYKLDDTQLLIVLEGLHFNIDKLFADEKIGALIEKTLNDNALEMYSDVQASYSSAFGIIYDSIFKQLLNKVPANLLFGENL